MDVTVRDADHDRRFEPDFRPQKFDEKKNYQKNENIV